MQELIGTQLGQYRIEAKIGQGGMAAVFKAYQYSLERHVAIKVLPPFFAATDPDFVERFKREATAVAQLNHPNVLPVYDFGIDHDYSYIVMRYVEGSHTLADLMRHPLSSQRAIHLISQVAEALSYAHRRGIIHRDVKPSNILLDNDWALLADFGLAKVSQEATRITGTGRGIGTAAYMSPEQSQGQEIDARTDIYALGIILYQMLTGKIPHDAETPLAIMMKRLTEPPPPPSKLSDDISGAVEQVILRALARDPDFRYDSASDFAAALKIASGDSAASVGVNGGADTYQTTAFGTQTFPVIPASTSQAGGAASDAAGPATNASGQASSTAVPQAEGGIWRSILAHPFWGLASFVVLLGVIIAFLLGVFSGGRGADFEGTPPSGSVVAGAPAFETVTKSLTPTATLEAERGTGGAVSPTSTETATATITREPTATPTATETPTSEPTETPTVISTASPTPTPTPTPTQTAESASARVTVTPTPAATTDPLAGLSGEAFSLVSPLDLDDPTYGPTRFEWRWQGPVPEGYGFEISVWQAGEPPLGAHDAVLDNQKDRVKASENGLYQLEADIRQAAGVRERSGIYQWSVSLVQISPEYAPLGIESQPGQLRFEAGGDTEGADEGTVGPVY